MKAEFWNLNIHVIDKLVLFKKKSTQLANGLTTKNTISCLTHWYNMCASATSVDSFRQFLFLREWQLLGKINQNHDHETAANNALWLIHSFSAASSQQKGAIKIIRTHTRTQMEISCCCNIFYTRLNIHNRILDPRTCTVRSIYVTILSHLLGKTGDGYFSAYKIGFEIP